MQQLELDLRGYVQRIGIIGQEGAYKVKIHRDHEAKFIGLPMKTLFMAEAIVDLDRWTWLKCRWFDRDTVPVPAHLIDLFNKLPFYTETRNSVYE